MNDVRWLVPAAVAAIVVSSGSAATASATPNDNLEAETLSQATVDGHDYVTRQITMAPGAVPGGTGIPAGCSA